MNVKTKRARQRGQPKSSSSIYDDMKSGKFPKPLKIGKRSVAWKYSDIELWINSLESSQRGANHE
jgi:prophage regulatory protein